MSLGLDPPADRPGRRRGVPGRCGDDDELLVSTLEHREVVGGEDLVEDRARLPGRGFRHDDHCGCHQRAAVEDSQSLPVQPAQRRGELHAGERWRRGLGRVNRVPQEDEEEHRHDAALSHRQPMEAWPDPPDAGGRASRWSGRGGLPPGAAHVPPWRPSETAEPGHLPGERCGVLQHAGGARRAGHRQAQRPHAVGVPAHWKVSRVVRCSLLHEPSKADREEGVAAARTHRARSGRSSGGHVPRVDRGAAGRGRSASRRRRGVEPPGLGTAAVRRAGRAGRARRRAPPRAPRCGGAGAREERGDHHRAGVAGLGRSGRDRGARGLRPALRAPGRLAAVHRAGELGVLRRAGGRGGSDHRSGRRRRLASPAPPLGR